MDWRRIDSKKKSSSSVPQSCLTLFATPWTTAHQASLSITNSWSLLKLMSVESVMPRNHLILCRPLLILPSIFPNIRVFSNESVLPLGLTSWIFLLSKGHLRVFSNTTVQKHQFFGVLVPRGGVFVARSQLRGDCGAVVKNPPARAGDTGSIPGLGRSPGGGNGNPLQYLAKKNPMDRGAWWATIPGVTRAGHDWVRIHCLQIKQKGNGKSGRN